MKKKSSLKAVKATEPVEQYDFSNGVRGKYVERYRAARVTVQLDPDVAQSFPDSTLRMRACGHSCGSGAVKQPIPTRVDSQPATRGVTLPF